MRGPPVGQAASGLRMTLLGTSAVPRRGTAVLLVVIWVLSIIPGSRSQRVRSPTDQHTTSSRSMDARRPHPFWLCSAVVILPLTAAGGC